MEMQKYKHKTKYDGVYVYIAPDGYDFWSMNTNYGSVVYGGDCLENHYYLKQKNNETDNNTITTINDKQDNG